jgi:hypothetical protein
LNKNQRDIACAMGMGVAFCLADAGPVATGGSPSGSGPAGVASVGRGGMVLPYAWVAMQAVRAATEVP